MVSTMAEGSSNLGYTETIVEHDDLVKWGVLDPAKVACRTLRNPSRLAGLPRLARSRSSELRFLMDRFYLARAARSDRLLRRSRCSRIQQKHSD